MLHVGVSARLTEAADLIRQIPGVVEAQTLDGHVRVMLEPAQANVATIAQRLVSAGLPLTRLEEEKINLETAFMRLTKGLVQ